LWADPDRVEHLVHGEEQMQIEQEHIGGRFVVRPIGRLDGVGSPLLEAAIDAYLDDGGKQLIIDFSRLVYISSIGLRVVLRAAKRLSRDGGQIILARLTPNVREVFEMSGFISLFPVIDDLGEEQSEQPSSANDVRGPA